MSIRRSIRMALERLFPQWTYQLLKWRWARNWSSADFSPGWKISKIPKEVQHAVESGWFQPGTSVLDIGCGSGEISAWLAEKNFNVLGVDYAEGAIAKAKSKYGEIEGKLEFRTVDICGELDNISERFEGLLDRGCLHGISRAFASKYAQNIALLSAQGARFLLLFATQKDDKPNLRHREKAQAEVFAFIQTSFQPAFEIVRIEPTTIERSSGPRVTEPAPALAVWMIRR